MNSNVKKMATVEQIEPTNNPPEEVNEKEEILIQHTVSNIQCIPTMTSLKLAAPNGIT